MVKRKKFTKVVPDEINVDDLTVLDISCGTTKCSDDFHCYSQKKSSLKKFGEERVCKECGVDLIDWERIHKNDLNDSEFVFQQMRSEIIRHVFWHTSIQNDALLKALLHGKVKTKQRALRTLKSRIGRNLGQWDGRQTPMGQGELINYAQHATATCCRKCLEAWHNIDPDVILTEDQLEFCADLVMKYIEKRVPQLEDHGLSEDEAVTIIEHEYN
ncbi:MAG TPA: DUF4186 family protein [Mucilaginibacter sp.]|nr:DUF4186 family protein [Mucilaginibacter sp.]